MCDVVCVPCCLGGAAPSSTATCSRRVVAAGVPWMAAADAGEATETAADCTMFFHGLPEVAAAGRLKPAVPPDEWAERELIEDDEPDEPDRCRPVAGPPYAATSLPHPQHGSSPTSRRLNRRGLRPCGRTHGGGRRSIPWSIHHSGRERSNHLLKLKNFQTDEYRVVGAEEATGKDAGTVVWICETSDGKKFNVRPKGSHKQRTAWFEFRDVFTDGTKKLTVQYQNLQESGIPRFPVGLAIRDYE